MIGDGFINFAVIVRDYSQPKPRKDKRLPKVARLSYR